MSRWLVIAAAEIQFDDVSGVDVTDGVVRYVFQRREDGSFGTIHVDGRALHPTSSMVYVHGNTVHVQVG
jgi:hypothetical protein